VIRLTLRRTESATHLVLTWYRPTGPGSQTGSRVGERCTTG